MDKYEERLLRALLTASPETRLFTANDYAMMWKRSKVDVSYAAMQLAIKGYIKIHQDGLISLCDVNREVVQSEEDYLFYDGHRDDHLIN